MTNQEVGLSVATPLDSPITSVGLPLLALRDQELYLEGTATYIGGGLAITARHVVQGIFERFHGRPFDGVEQPTFEVRTFAMPGDGQPPLRLAVRRWWSPAPSDIAVLELAPFYQSDVGRSLNQPRIDLFPPREGSRVSAFGYPRSSSQPDGHTGIVVNTNATTASGTVLEVHHQQLDNAMIPFPCYRTNLPIEGAMSGGPVFNERGHLCGIVCASFTLDDPSAPAISYMSTLWPMLAICIDSPRPNIIDGATYPIYELARRGVISCTDLDRDILEEVRENGATIACPSVYCN